MISGRTVKGYNNYIFFLESFLKKMKGEQEASHVKEPEDANADSGENAVCAFLTQECGDIGLISMIPGIRSRMKNYQKKYQPEDSVEAQDYDAVRKLMLECAEWKHSLDGESGEKVKESIALLSKSLEERSRRCARDIEEGTNLYSTLTELLTHEWMRQFDPDADNSPLDGMNAMEIQAFYQNGMKEIEEKLLKVYRRK